MEDKKGQKEGGKLEDSCGMLREKSLEEELASSVKWKRIIDFFFNFKSKCCKRMVYI